MDGWFQLVGDLEAGRVNGCLPGFVRITLRVEEQVAHTDLDRPIGEGRDSGDAGRRGLATVRWAAPDHGL